MPTIGAFRWVPPSEPWKPAAPKVNTPPSAAASQYPEPSAKPAMPTIGAFRWVPLAEPWNGAPYHANTPPSLAAVQKREPGIGPAGSNADASTITNMLNTESCGGPTN